MEAKRHIPHTAHMKNAYCCHYCYLPATPRMRFCMRAARLARGISAHTHENSCAAPRHALRFALACTHACHPTCRATGENGWKHLASTDYARGPSFPRRFLSGKKTLLRLPTLQNFCLPHGSTSQHALLCGDTPHLPLPSSLPYLILQTASTAWVETHAMHACSVSISDCSMQASSPSQAGVIKNMACWGRALCCV